MKKLLLIISFTIAVLTLGAQTTLDTAVNFTVKDPYGNSYTLFDILDEGKLVVIDFFSTAWGTCQLYAPDMQATYETFGCNDGNVFLIGIDKGNSNAAVLYFDSVYGVHFPDVSGNGGSGNLAHLLYNVQATPTIVIINPDRSIAVKQIYPPSQTSVSDSIFSHGGVQQECFTAIVEKPGEEVLHIRPNPVHEKVYIHFNLDKRSDVELIIYDLSGRIVWQSRPGKYEVGKFYVEMNLSGTEKGFYHVQLKLNGKEVAIQKLIKI